MSNALIRQALETRLKAWADVQTPKPPVAYQNVSFTKPTTGYWLESFLIPSSAHERETSASKKTYLGMFQVNVWTPRGIGMQIAERTADSIVASFPVVPKIGVVSVESTKVDASISDESGWVAVPVLINYRYET